MRQWGRGLGKTPDGTVGGGVKVRPLIIWGRRSQGKTLVGRILGHRKERLWRTSEMYVQDWPDSLILASTNLSSTIH